MSHATCLHCRRPSLTGDFCCGGCKAVYSLIHESGLERFYDLASHKFSIGVVSLPTKSDYSILNDALPDDITEIDKGKLKEIIFPISGIHCAGCIWLLEKLSHPGIISSRVSASTGEITILYNPEEVKRSEIATLLDSFGYPIRKSDEPIDSLNLWRIALSGFCMMNIMMLSVSLHEGSVSGMDSNIANFFKAACFLLTIPLLWVGGAPFFKNALIAVKAKEPHIDIPLSIAIVASFLSSTYSFFVGENTVYFDSIAALIFFLLCGRYAQEAVLSKARRSLSRPLGLAPLTARKDGQVIKTEELIPGDIITVLPSEKFPTTVEVLEGSTEVDESSISGESFPIVKSKGDLVEAGSINLYGIVKASVAIPFKETILSRSLKSQIQSALLSSERVFFIKEITHYFTIALLLIAAINYAIWFPSVQTTCALLLVACPCGFGIAIPLLFASSISRAAEKGVIIRSAAALLQISQVKKIFLDKTGTLTNDRLEIEKIEIENPEITEALRLAASITPSHPVSRAILEKFGEIDPPTSGKYIPGKGVSWSSNGSDWVFGRDSEQQKTSASLYKDGKLLTSIYFSSSIRENAKELIQELSSKGEVCLISGDKNEPTRKLALDLGIKNYRSNLLPLEKADLVGKHESLMIGDGFNDREALQAATISIGLKGTTTDTSNIYIADGSLSLVRMIIRGAARLRSRMWLIVSVSAIYNIAGVILSMTGIITPLLAAILMPISSLSLVLLAISLDVFRK